MELYHVTPTTYLDSIREHGILSMAEKDRRGLYPAGHTLMPEMFRGENDLVWLTKDPEPQPGWSHPEMARLTVALEGFTATRWQQAANRYGVPDWWRQTLRKVAGGGNDRDWYIVEARIPADAIRTIEILEAEAVDSTALMERAVIP